MKFKIRSTSYRRPPIDGVQESEDGGEFYIEIETLEQLIALVDQCKASADEHHGFYGIIVANEDYYGGLHLEIYDDYRE